MKILLFIIMHPAFTSVSFLRATTFMIQIKSKLVLSKNYIFCKLRGTVAPIYRSFYPLVKLMTYLVPWEKRTPSVS